MGELSVLSSALGDGGWEVSRSSLLSVLQCKLGEGGEGRKQNWTVNSPLSAACTACRHAKPWVDFAWDKLGPRSDPYPDSFGTG